MRWCHAVIGLIALALTIACGGAGAVMPTPTPIPYPTDPEALVLRIETSGGLLPPFALLTALPEFSLYGDGTIVTLGPQILIYPPPALPNLLQSRIDARGIQLILKEAAAAGLLAGDADFPLEGVADAPTTFFTVNAGGRISRVSVYALGLEDPSDPRLTPEQRAARERLAAFAQRARDVLSWLPPETILEREQPFAITRLQVIVWPANALPAPEENTIPSSLRPWPLPTPLAELGEPAPWAGPTARCSVISSQQELTRLLAELSTASSTTRWESGGEPYSLAVRPLLPDETGCEPRSWR